jgi:hypothetical protein
VLGNHIALKFIGANKTAVALLHRGTLLKAVNLLGYGCQKTICCGIGGAWGEA